MQFCSRQVCRTEGLAHSAHTLRHSINRIVGHSMPLNVSRCLWIHLDASGSLGRQTDRWMLPCANTHGFVILLHFRLTGRIDPQKGELSQVPQTRYRASEFARSNRPRRKSAVPRSGGIISSTDRETGGGCGRGSTGRAAIEEIVKLVRDPPNSSWFGCYSSSTARVATRFGEGISQACAMRDSQAVRC
jgi:hypothetical protein